MKQLLIIIVSLVTLSSCCSFNRQKEYKQPETPTIETSTVIVGETKDKVWDRLIVGLRDVYSPFTINSMDKNKGHIKISYSGDPCPYVDCGQLSAEFNNTGRVFDPPFSTPLLFRNTYPACREFLEYTLCKETDIPWEACKMIIKRTMWLESSSYIEVIESARGVEVHVLTSYAVTQKVKVYKEDGFFENQTYDTINFGPYNTGTFPDNETTCRSNNMLEKTILSIAQ